MPRGAWRTLEKFRQNQCKLRHQDMEILAISIHESATAVSVQETLETVSDKSRWLNLDSYLDWAEKVLCFGKVSLVLVQTGNGMYRA